MDNSSLAGIHVLAPVGGLVAQCRPSLSHLLLCGALLSFLSGSGLWFLPKVLTRWRMTARLFRRALFESETWQGQAGRCPQWLTFGEREAVREICPRPWPRSEFLEGVGWCLLSAVTRWTSLTRSGTLSIQGPVPGQATVLRSLTSSQMYQRLQKPL